MARKGIRLTANARALFLAELARIGNVTYAARVGGFSRETAYALRHNDPDFARAWDDALDQAADVLEREAWRRAHDGVPEPVVSMGKLVRDDDGVPMTVQKYSDNLLVTLLKAARPHKYRENVKISGGMTHHLVPSEAARPLREALLEQLGDAPEARSAVAAALLALAGGDAA